MQFEAQFLPQVNFSEVCDRFEQFSHHPNIDIAEITL